MYEANIVTEEVKTTNPQDSQVVNDKAKKRFRFNWKKFVGYFFLGILVLGIGYLGYRFYEFKPYRVIVSNVTSRSATISWVTDSAEPGMVVYKEGNTILPVWISKYGVGNGYDDRDYSNAELEAANKTQENIAESEDITADDIETEIIVTELGRYWSHHVTIRNLDPETEYEFMVGDGLVFEKVSNIYTDTSIVTTTEELDTIKSPDPAYGTIRYYYEDEDGDASYIRSNNAIVYVTVREDMRDIESEFVSSITNEDGGWYLDLSNVLTAGGENFWDYLSESTEEYGNATNISLKLTIEDAWFGRWSKEIIYPEDVAPADVIDLNQDHESEGDLIYEGMFNEEKIGNGNVSTLNPSIYIYKTFAATTIRNNEKKEVDVQTLSESAKTKETYYQDMADLYRSLANQGSKDAAVLDDKYQDLADTSYEVSKQTNVKKIEEKNNYLKELEDDLKDILSGSTITTTDINITDEYRLAAKGTCTSDICEMTKEELEGKTGDIIVGQCGYVNNFNCDCTCGDETISIRKGTSCVCSVDSVGNITASEDGEVLNSIEELEGSKYSTLCSDNNTIKLGESKDCYSSTNQCYYSAGTLNLSGSECLSSGRWGKEDYTYSSTVVSQEGVSAQDTLVSAENGYKACKDTSSGLIIYASICGNGHEGIETNDVLCVDNSGNIYASSSCSGDYSYLDTSSYSICINILGNKIKVDKDDPTCSSTGYKPLDSATEEGSDEQVTCYTYKKDVGEGEIEVKYSTATSLGGYSLIGEPYPTTEGNCNRTYTVDDWTVVIDEDNQYIINKEIEGIEKGGECDGKFYLTNGNGSFFCNGSKYKEAPGNRSVEPGEYCDLVSGTSGFAKNEENNYTEYICSSNVWIKAEKSNENLAVTYDEITSGNCTAFQCQCTYYEIENVLKCPDKYGEYILDFIKDESVCKKEEAKEMPVSKLKKTKDLKNGEPCETVYVENGSVLDNSVYADSSYVINTTAGIAQKLGVGTYIFEANGDEYIVYINQGDEDKDIYLDVNENGAIDDEDINVSEDFETINVKTMEKQFGYTLKEGFNFVSFPFIFTNEDIKTASDLLTYLNDRYNNAFYSISKYDSGKWVIVGSNGGTYDQNDFQLIPGQGYVLKAKTDIYITLYGNEVTYEYITDSAPIRFMPGWNLVGLYGTSVKSYTAESILTDITNYEDINFTAVNVSRWVESRALYEALQRDTDGTVYGLDFPIELKKSYFIKVTEGEGNWEPGIE